MTKTRLKQLIEYAALAPSVHNTQPWRFKLTDKTVAVWVEPTNVLEHGDPAQRQLWLSLGACIENLNLAAAELGLRIKQSSYRFPRDFKKLPVASFEIAAKRQPAQAKQWLEAMRTRVTDRHRFQKTAIKPVVLRQIASSWRSANIKVVVSDQAKLLALLGKLTAQGMRMALGHPSFRAELNQLVHYNWRRVDRGLPGYVLKRGHIGSVLEKASLATGLRIKKKAQSDGRLIAAGPAVVLVFSRGDVPRYWLEAGRAYQHTVLAATSLGLHHSTTAAVVEAGDFHEDIEQLAGTDWRLQTVARIGYPTVKQLRHTPRLAVEKLLIT